VVTHHRQKYETLTIKAPLFWGVPLTRKKRPLASCRSVSPCNTAAPNGLIFMKFDTVDLYANCKETQYLVTIGQQYETLHMKP